MPNSTCANLCAYLRIYCTFCLHTVSLHVQWTLVCRREQLGVIFQVCLKSTLLNAGGRFFNIKTFSLIFLSFLCLPHPGLSRYVPCYVRGRLFVRSFFDSFPFSGTCRWRCFVVAKKGAKRCHFSWPSRGHMFVYLYCQFAEYTCQCLYCKLVNFSEKASTNSLL